VQPVTPLSPVTVDNDGATRRTPPSVTTSGVLTICNGNLGFNGYADVFLWPAVATGGIRGHRDQQIGQLLLQRQVILMQTPQEAVTSYRLAGLGAGT
jgi:hypothetical protein